MHFSQKTTRVSANFLLAGRDQGGQFWGIDDTSPMRRALFLFCGFCWLAFGAGMGVFLLRYLVEGAGFQDSGFVVPQLSGVCILMGLVHVVGFFVLALFCFLVGIGLCAYSIGPTQGCEQKLALPKRS